MTRQWGAVRLAAAGQRRQERPIAPLRFRLSDLTLEGFVIPESERRTAGHVNVNLSLAESMAR